MFDMLLKSSTLSFPGLGIGEFTINSVAFTVFGHEIAWYGVIITFGIILSAIYGLSRAKLEGISSDDMLDVILAAVIFSVIGARIYYVLFYGNYKTFYDVIAIWNGGLAIYGAGIAGAITLCVMAKIKKKSPLVLLDIGAASIPLGQAIGRWGNFMNAEAYGYETTLPWRMGIAEAGGTIYVHPTFFYESLWNFIGFFLIWYLYKKKKFNGQIFLTYIAWYGFGRMFVEGLRTDSLWLIPGVIRVSQLLGAVSFAIAAALLIFFCIKFRKRTPILESHPIAVADNTEKE